MPNATKRYKDPDWWIPRRAGHARPFWATDKELENSLRHLYDRLTGRVEEPQLSINVSLIVERVARGECARMGVSLDDLLDDPNIPEAREVFVRAWPWRLPLGEKTGSAIMDGSYWRYIGPDFEDTSWVPF